MNDDGLKVLKLLEAGFPKPDLPDQPELSGFQFDTEERLASRKAHDAVHEGDPEFRAQMVMEVAEKLISGTPLLVPERAWLLYVLKTIGYNCLPNEHRGRAPIPVFERVASMYRLGVAMIEERIASPEATVTEGLRKSAAHLGKSYESVRALYYSAAYKRLAERGAFERFRRKNMGTDK